MTFTRSKTTWCSRVARHTGRVSRHPGYALIHTGYVSLYTGHVSRHTGRMMSGVVAMLLLEARGYTEEDFISLRKRGF